MYDNLVEDNARAGIFFHRSTDYAEAYNNTCRRNLEGDFGIVESVGVKVFDNVMEVCPVFEFMKNSRRRSTVGLYICQQYVNTPRLKCNGVPDGSYISASVLGGGGI